VIETPLIAEHTAASARLTEFDGVQLPESFSSFESEYRAARDTVALVDTNWHAIIALTGKDRVQYLHNITSNDIKSLADGRGTLALLLNPQGRILAELEVYAQPEKLTLLSHASQRERTVATLKKFVIGSKVVVDDLTDKMGTLALQGPRAAVEQLTGIRLADAPELSIHDAAVDGIAIQLLRRSHYESPGAPGAEFLAAREDLPALWRKLLAAVRAQGGAPVGMAALNALRLEAGIPWFPADFNDGMIPHEAALEHTHISFNKGCYTGQEIVERVRSRGHVNRKRVLLKFSVAQPPPAGTKLRAPAAQGASNLPGSQASHGAPTASSAAASSAATATSAAVSATAPAVGTVTSAALSPGVGSAIGMGYVRREHFAPGSILEFDGGTAEVIEKKVVAKNTAEEKVAH
jgi:folate-binding protein YgfZ